MKTSQNRLMLAGALLCSLLLSPTLAAAVVQVSTHTPHVCDWFFDHGPSGKESRVWLGVPPSYFTIAWFQNGPAIGYPIEYYFLASGPGGSSSWYVEAYYQGEIITGFAELDLKSLPYAVTLSHSIVDLSNGGNLFCQELNSQAQAHLRTAYRRTGSLCACGSNFAYDSTVGCISRCVARWNRDSMWIGPAPDCLDSPEVKDQLICLLSNDPRFPPLDPDCDLYPDDPRCGPGIP